MSELTLDYQLTRAEWMRGLWRHNVRWPLFWFYVTPGIGMGLFLVILGSQRQLVGAIAGGLAALGFWIWLIAYTPFLRWSRDQSLAAPRKVMLDDQGVRIETTAWSSNSNWTRFRTVREAESGYDFSWGMGWMTIPKRAFTTPEDGRSFRTLVSTHLERSRL